MFTPSIGAGTRTGCLDLEQISSLHVAPRVASTVRAVDLFAMVEVFAGTGAQHVMVKGVVAAQAVRELRCQVNVRIIRLAATKAQL